MNSLTGSFRKINVTLKKRVDYTSIPDYVKCEALTKIRGAYNTEARIGAILDMLLKHADRDYSRAFLEFCQDQVMAEIDTLERLYMDDMEERPKFPKQDHNIEISPIYTDEHGVKYIEITTRDKNGDWWSQWKPIPWSKENEEKRWQVEYS